MDAIGEIERRAREIGESIDEFAANAAIFSARMPELLDSYEDKWVAIYAGGIAAAADSLESVIKALANKGIPAGKAVVRKVDREPKTFIL